MLLQSPWTPRLADIEANVAERLIRALADDIVEGRLTGGDRLPAHRDLAWKLGIGLGTVTKAYAALERRGLTRVVKGRGTFVATLAAQGEGGIDLSSNVPPARLHSRLLARTLTDVARRIDADHLNLYAPPGGHPEHRVLLSRWLETLGLPIDPARLLLTGGGRQALTLAFDLACGPRGMILTERITYPGAIALARRGGHRMRGVEIDAEGMVPAALAHVLGHRVSDGATAVYLTPTLHNPTTATMGEERRRAIVDICRRAGTWIVEDGVYMAPGASPSPLAALAPDIVLHVNGLSKSLGPGLQIGTLALPCGMREAGEALLRDTPMAPSPLSCAVVAEWLAAGEIAAIQRDLYREARRRSDLAAATLGAHGLVSDSGAYNAWLPMVRGDAERVVSAAAELHIGLTPPDAVMVHPDDQASGIRLCLGGPSLDALAEALARLDGLLRGERASATTRKEGSVGVTRPRKILV